MKPGWYTYKKRIPQENYNAHYWTGKAWACLEWTIPESKQVDWDLLQLAVDWYRDAFDHPAESPDSHCSICYSLHMRPKHVIQRLLDD